MKKTKIVATLGPSSSDIKVIEEMVREGVDVFRINLSYSTQTDCDSYIEKIREVSKKTKKILGIMLDLDGPSIRIDNLIEDKVFLDIGKEIKFYNYHVVCNNTQLSTNYNNLVELVKINDIISIGNGDVKLKVIDINSDNFLCNVVDSGYIKSNQTIHVKESYLKMPFINEKDYDNIMYAINKNIDFLALSYVRDEQDVLSVIDMLIENENDHISLISKIETEEGYNNIDSILKVSDGVMVARGDLGVNVPFEKLPYYQKEILKKANEYQKLSLVATDLLKSMVNEKSPSRAEAADIYNIILDKADSLVLSDETTIGNYPVLSVKVMSKILEEAEEHFDYRDNLDKNYKEGNDDVTSTIAYSVVDSGLLLGVNCILANTMSGYTAKKISCFKPKSLILGLSPNKDTLTSLTLNYGIIPVLVKKYKNSEEIPEICITKYKEVMNYHEGDTVIITGGLPSVGQNTDFMKIEKI